jgi:hypothetical protein
MQVPTLANNKNNKNNKNNNNNNKHKNNNNNNTNNNNNDNNKNSNNNANNTNTWTGFATRTTTHTKYQPSTQTTTTSVITHCGEFPHKTLLNLQRNQTQKGIPPSAHACTKQSPFKETKPNHTAHAVQLIVQRL